MDFYDAIKTRRSVRGYRSDPIPEDVLNRVLDAARLAPSGSNRQPTRFILVEEEQARKRLAQLCHNQHFIAGAPIVVVACGREIPSNRGGYMGRYSMLVDAAIAVDHLTLAARAEGLGTCWIGAFENAAIKDFLGVPEECQVVAITPLGYPQGDPFKETKDRLPVSELICRQRWAF